MLATTWSGQDVAGWWLSEKWDGVRLYWTGSELRTRSWREIIAPAWFKRSLPAGVAIDGELFAGRGAFQIASELARFSRPNDPEWRRMRFMAFDWPTTDAIRFEQRQWKLAQFENETLRPVAVRRCLGAVDAREELAAVVQAGGEGLMLKRPGHSYAFERSRDWLKVKPAGIE
jgi:DNA ligase-1